MNSTQRRVILAITLFTLAVAVFAGGGGTAEAAACTTTLAAGSDIQLAIDAASPGDVICLAAGQYAPTAKIDVNKSITLQGPQAGVDPRPVAGSGRTEGDLLTEAVIDGSVNGLSGIMVISADDVVLEGLDITGGTGDMIDSDDPISGLAIKYTMVHDSALPGDEGMQIRNCTGCTVEYNYVVRIAQDGINMCCDSTGGTIQFNEVAKNSSENAAVYIYDASNIDIYCNTIFEVHHNEGIKFGDKRGGDAAASGGVISYNTIYTTAQDGIAVYMSDTTVKGNDISGSSSENGAIYLAYAISNISVVNNKVHDNTLDAGKWGDPGAIMVGTDVSASTVYVNDNNITNNSVNGVTNKAAALLDATSNWWGAADGPAPAGSGDAVSANVDFDPYLTAAVDIADPCTPISEIEAKIKIRPRHIWYVFDDDDEDELERSWPWVLWVFVYSGDDLDATTLDPATVTVGDPVLAGATAPYRHWDRDFNRDGKRDRLFFVRTKGLWKDDAIAATTTELKLTGQTADGVDVFGSSTVRVRFVYDD